MAKYTTCDNCGDRDDWAVTGSPFFPDGVVLQFRGSGGTDDFEHTLELCELCKEKLLKALPALANVMSPNAERSDPATPR